MGTEIVIALYKAKPGRESDLEKLIAQHVPVLKELELVTSRPRLIAKLKKYENLVKKNTNN